MQKNNLFFAFSIALLHYAFFYFSCLPFCFSFCFFLKPDFLECFLVCFLLLFFKRVIYRKKLDPVDTTICIHVPSYAKGIDGIRLHQTVKESRTESFETDPDRCVRGWKMWKTSFLWFWLLDPWSWSQVLAKFREVMELEDCSTPNAARQHYCFSAA